MASSFRADTPFEKRQALAAKIRASYPDRVPVIVEKSQQGRNQLPEIDRKKFLAPTDISVAKFHSEIMKHIPMTEATSVNLFVAATMPMPALCMGLLYDQHKADDGFLYISYAPDEGFGAR